MRRPAARKRRRRPPQYGQKQARSRKTPAKRALTGIVPYASEDDLAFAVAEALDILLPKDAVWTAWDFSKAGKVEGGRKKKLGVKAGWPDLGVFWRGVMVPIELKIERGRLRTEQKALHPRLAAAGFPVTVCRSVNAVLKTLADAGISLRGKVMA
jgi:hypothetical protein